MLKKIWKIPRTYSKKERGSSLLELFFDIIVVVMLGSVVQTVSTAIEEVYRDHHGVFKNSDVLHISFAFMQMVTGLFIWRAFSLYSSRYQKEIDIRHTFFTLIAMLGMALVVAAVYIDPNTAKGLSEITIINGTGIFITASTIGYLNLTAGRFAKCKYERKSLYWSGSGKIFFVIMSLINIAIFNINGYATKFSAISSWAISLLIWMALEYKANSNEHFANTGILNRDHLQERYSILFIIFTGEMLMNIVRSSIKDGSIDIGGLVTGVLLLFSWFWWFRQVYNYPDLIAHPKRIFLYTFAMLGIMTSVTFSIVGISLILEHKEASRAGYIIFVLGTGIWTFFESMVVWTMRAYKKKHKLITLRYWIIFKKLSFPFWLATVLFWPFIPGTNGEMFLYYMTAYCWITVGVHIINKIYVMTYSKWNKEKFEEIFASVQKEEEKWIQDSIVPHIDKSWHEENGFNVNEFSEIAKTCDPNTMKRKRKHKKKK